MNRVPIRPKQLFPIFEKLFHTPTAHVNRISLQPKPFSRPPPQVLLGGKTTTVPALKTRLEKKYCSKQQVKKRAKTEWRKMMEDYYLRRLTNSELTPMLYLLGTCQRSHEVRRMFLRKWRKLQVDGFLNENRCLEVPAVKCRFDHMFRSRHAFIQAAEKRSNIHGKFDT